jgi:NADPH-dependent 7-cyano-7-deazaguanine reductase QueF-like protein
MPTISALGAKTVTINWQPANFASWYEIKLSNSPAPPSVGTATSYLNYTSNTLTPSTTYYFHIRSYCSAGDISPWKTLSFTTEPLGINNLSNDIKVEVFPNPVNDDLHIKIDGNLNSSSKVILLDITGKVLSEKNITQKESTIDMKGTAPGIYILKYEDEDTFGALRIIKE